VFAGFHGFHDSHRFGPFFHVFHEFFVLFFVPEERENRGFSKRILVIPDSWAMGTRPGTMPQSPAAA
jgi:hypothetical protein